MMIPELFLTTYSGNEVWLDDVTKNHYSMEDISHALSQTCRFGGHTMYFYSVAQHSVLCSYLVDPEFAWDALMHDATEAYLGDMPTPVKSMLPDYREIEGRLEESIFKQFNVRHPLPDEVKRADLIALATERRDLIADQATVWSCLDGIEPHPEEIRPWTPRNACAAFQKRVIELVEAGLAPL